MLLARSSFSAAHLFSRFSLSSILAFAAFASNSYLKGPVFGEAMMEFEFDLDKLGGEWGKAGSSCWRISRVILLSEL